MQILDGIQSIADNYDHFILDIWGVLHNGVAAYSTVPNALRELKSRGKGICLLSNSPERADRIPPLLDSMGITRDMYDHVITSGESTHHELEQYEGRNIYCLNPHESPTSMTGLSLTRVESPSQADIVLISHMPRLSTAEEFMPVLEECRKHDLKIICANPDKVVDVGGTLYLCAGGVADLYEDMGGTVSWHGKPYAPVYDWALKLLGNPDKSRVIAIGDSIRTDVTGACNYGIDVLWNAVGIHWMEITINGAIDNDKIKRTLQDLPHAPTGILKGLSW